MRIYTIALWLTLAAALFLGGCEKEGPAEQAGENVDQTMEQAGENVDQTMEQAGDKMEEAGDKIEEKTGN